MHRHDRRSRPDPGCWSVRVLIQRGTLPASAVHAAREQLEWRHRLHVLARDVRQVLLGKRSTLVKLRVHHVDVDDLTSAMQVQALDGFWE